VKVFDHKLRTNVALKIVRNEKRFHKQAQEEIRILKHLRQQVGKFKTFQCKFHHWLVITCLLKIAVLKPAM